LKLTETPASIVAGKPTVTDADDLELLPFTAHKLDLGGGVFTLEHGEDPFTTVATRVLSQALGHDFTRRRILDLGCLEGGFAIAFATLGAREVIGIEARPTNLKRADMARERLGVRNVSFIQGDVNKLDVAALGSFDVVFASGILYHLDDPFSFVERVFELTSDVALFDTHVALPDVHNHGLSASLLTRSHNGHDYVGRVYFEYPPEASQDEVEYLLWNSYSNSNSFWLREHDLVRLLYETGFQRVYKAPQPPGYKCSEGCPGECRVILVAKRHGAVDCGDVFVEIPRPAGPATSTRPRPRRWLRRTFRRS
jgi:SAM-dependent methyltransferase